MRCRSPAAAVRASAAWTRWKGRIDAERDHSPPGRAPSRRCREDHAQPRHCGRDSRAAEVADPRPRTTRRHAAPSSRFSWQSCRCAARRRDLARNGVRNLVSKRRRRARPRHRARATRGAALRSSLSWRECAEPRRPGDDADRAVRQADVLTCLGVHHGCRLSFSRFASDRGRGTSPHAPGRGRRSSGRCNPSAARRAHQQLGPYARMLLPTAMYHLFAEPCSTPPPPQPSPARGEVFLTDMSSQALPTPPLRGGTGGWVRRSRCLVFRSSETALDGHALARA